MQTTQRNTLSELIGETNTDSSLQRRPRSRPCERFVGELVEACSGRLGYHPDLLCLVSVFEPDPSVQMEANRLGSDAFVWISGDTRSGITNVDGNCCCSGAFSVWNVNLRKCQWFWLFFVGLDGTLWLCRLSWWRNFTSKPPPIIMMAYLLF